MKVLKEWEELPAYMRTKEVYPYFCNLHKKRNYLIVKRVFDIIASILLIIILSPIMSAIALTIKLDSKGPVLFLQVRVTQYGRKFRIYKFRTMTEDAEKTGSQITARDDKRITKVGKKLRKLRLDELPQLFNILKGDMSFVGTRPEVPKYVKCYTGAMWATLLLPAGVTSEASMMYKDEERLLDGKDGIDEIYIRKVIPEKMKYNLESIMKINCFNEIRVIFRTVAAVVR